MHRIFVYGSLKRGGQFHHLLGRRVFLGEARTPPAFTLIDLGNYPGLLHQGHTTVWGEVYSVDSWTLTRLDELEEHPDVYVRTPLLLPPWETIETYMLRPEFAEGRVLASGRWMT